LLLYTRVKLVIASLVSCIFTRLLVIHFATIVIIYLLIYILVYCCNIGQQSSFACPFDILACISPFCLLSGIYNTLLQVHFTSTTYPYPQKSYPSHFPLPNSTYRGFHSRLLIFHFIPPGSLRFTPCGDFSSPLKWGECPPKVKIGGYSHSSPTFVDLVGLYPTYNVCDDRSKILHAIGKRKAIK